MIYLHKTFTEDNETCTFQLEENLKLAATLRQELSGFIIGFDLVGQEDLGRPLLDFADQLIEAKNRTGLKYFFHAGETNWQGNIKIIFKSPNLFTFYYAWFDSIILNYQTIYSE